MERATQVGTGELLQALGSRPRGRKRDCPWCGGRGTVSVNEAKGLFCCHHAGCDFHGGIGSLRRLLNLPFGGPQSRCHAGAIEEDERKRAAAAAQRAWGIWRGLKPCP